MKNQFEKTFSIGDAAKMSGASQKQIRNWESRGRIPEAARVVAGERAYRRFTVDQVQLITKIRNYLDEGFTLSAASEKAHSDLNQETPHNEEK
jgi:DNA-binding transcriptional MerR regulator